MVTIFAREITDDLTSLVKQIDTLIGKNKDQKMAGFVVILSDDPDATETKLTELAEKNGIKNLPLTVFDGIAGPPNYKISKDADVTVLMWKGLTVKTNHAFAPGKLNKAGVKKVVASTKSILK